MRHVESTPTVMDALGADDGLAWDAPSKPRVIYPTSSDSALESLPIDVLAMIAKSCAEADLLALLSGSQRRA